MSTMLETISTLKAGNDANEAKKFEAAQLEQKANESKAISQKNAALEKEQAQLIRSSAAAAAGKTGTSGVNDIFDKITAEGHSRLLTQLYMGNAEARQDKLSAQIARIEGKNIKRASRIKAVADITKSLESAFTARPSTGSNINMTGGANNGSVRGIQGSLQSKYPG